MAAAYHQRWEEETANGQLKTHLRGPGNVLRSKLPDLMHQEIWAYLIVHHAISALTARASAAADLGPDRISFAKALRLIRRTATGTADIPSSHSPGPGPNPCCTSLVCPSGPVTCRVLVRTRCFQAAATSGARVNEQIPGRG